MTACGGSGGGSAKSTKGLKQGKTTSGTKTTTTGGGDEVPTVGGPGSGVGSALDTPFSIGSSFVPSANLGAAFSRDSSGRVELTSGNINTSQPFGFGPDCLMPAGDYSLSTKEKGVQATKDHHYQGVVIEGVGPVNFTATVLNVSAKDFQGTWKMQGVIAISKVGNKNCTGFGIPMEIRYTF